MNNQRRIFIQRMLMMAGATVIQKPLVSLAAAGVQKAAVSAARNNSAIFLQDQFLDKDLADALCTMIVLGYAKSIPNCTFQYDANNKDLSKNKEEETVHKEVAALLGYYGATVTVSPSDNVNNFSFVFAKIKSIPNIKAAKLQLQDDYVNYLRSINTNANMKTPPPYGAYVGGMSVIGKLSIVGPSQLDQYKPVYRAANDSEVKASYDKSVKNTNNAVDALKKANLGLNKALVVNTGLIAAETRSFSAGSIYKSCHGMVQAMVKYKNNGDKSKFIFEIALGENTTKVSSCFPCSTFMAANDIPASSTHLGRGDNWNIPTDAYEMRKNWEKQINLWYSTAKGLLQAKSNAKTNNLLAMMANNHREQNVPAIFLEALTFERPFTERIKNTLEIKPK